MKKQKDNYYLRRKLDNQKMCNHDNNHWCSNCVNKGEKLDLRKQGLGQGFFITNK